MRTAMAASNAARPRAGTLREYLEELAIEVAAGVAAGKSLKEIQTSLRFDKYKGWERGDVQPPIHIAQVYATMRGTR